MSTVVAHRVEGGKLDMRSAICSRDGREKCGVGSGERRLRLRRSAIKAAFSDVFGLRKAVKLEVVGMLEYRG